MVGSCGTMGVEINKEAKPLTEDELERGACCLSRRSREGGSSLLLTLRTQSKAVGSFQAPAALSVGETHCLVAVFCPHAVS